MTPSIWCQCAHDLFWHGPAGCTIKGCGCSDFVSVSLHICDECKEKEIIN